MTRLFSRFRGGVHPDGFKELSSSQSISILPVPEQLYVPLRQHAGSDAIAAVKAGDHVLKGQLIANPGTGLSAPVHAPSSGKVRAVEPVTAAHPSGMKCNAVIIDCDGEDRSVDPTPLANPFEHSPQTLSDIIAAAGIVGMGGASFPAAVKLASAVNRQIETVLINGGECEPYLTADDRLMCERSTTIVLGARLISHVVGADKVAIVIEDNKPEAIAAMRQAAQGYSDIDVVKVPTRYPMGSAKQMIQAATGREVPAGGRSSDVGVLMHNVATAYAIAEAVVKGTPLVSRIVTVSGGAIVRPQNVEAPIGTPARALIDFCGGTLEPPARLLLGGPMMGHIIPDDQVPLIKGVAGVLALQAEEISQHSESPCIRCSRCVSACPMGLIPLEMANHARQQDFEGANNYGLKDCILCGSCAYVCPSHIPLVHYFQFAKGQISAQHSKQKHTELTRQLSEARRQRLEKEAAVKAAAKAARAAKRRPKPTATTAPE